MPIRPRDDLILLDSVDSTNRYALREAASIPSGTAVVADEQTAGRGRQGRRWMSPPAVNLYLSILLKPPLPATALTVFPWVAAVAAQEALADFGVAAWVKWPNDLYVDEAKIGGVLCETDGRPEGAGPLVVGIGLNLNMTAEQLAGVDQPATSVREQTGERVPRGEFLDVLLRRFDSLYQGLLRAGPEPLWARWRAASRLLGRDVCLSDAAGEARTGRVVDLPPDGSLEVETAAGVRRRFRSGDVSLRPV